LLKALLLGGHKLQLITASVSKDVQMKRILVSLIPISVLLIGCAIARPTNAVKSTEQEIRAALCELERNDFVNSQNTIRTVLKSEPENVYAHKILLGILTRVIKFGDSSAENKTRVKTAIDAYDQARNSAVFTPKEKTSIDRYLLFLYRQFSEAELIAELERRAIDQRRGGSERADYYAVLASKSWDCSFWLTSKKDREKSETERAKTCVTRGLDYADLGIAMDANSDSVWTYKAVLLKEASKLAQFENNSAQQAIYQKQSAEAEKRSSQLLSAKREAEEKEPYKTSDEDMSSAASLSPDDTSELTEYHAETSLADAVKEVFVSDFELSSLLAPIPLLEEKPRETTAPRPQAIEAPQPTKGCFREIDGEAQVQEKREWKQFSSDGDLTADLPDNVCQNFDAFIAASEGVKYTIKSLERPALAVSPEIIDRVINISARTFLSFRSRIWVGSGLTNVFDVKLLRKDYVNGEPRKTYGYSLVSCAKRKENVLVVQAGKSHYYTVDISGANETDPRVQRFIKSISFK
jgi:hypothetical protein